MACPTCDHTMQGVSEWVWWCPRCGTLKDPNGTTKPKLVCRVLDLVKEFGDEDEIIVPFLKQFGILELIALPENRR